jgi:DNA-binding CsgD family transcriptional regulator
MSADDRTRAPARREPASAGTMLVVCGACGASLDASPTPDGSAESSLRTSLRPGQVLAAVGGQQPMGVELDGLTPREREIVVMLLQGYRVKSITRLLGIASSTVNNHLRTVRMKYGVASQAELVERLREHGPKE